MGVNNGSENRRSVSGGPARWARDMAGGRARRGRDDPSQAGAHGPHTRLRVRPATRPGTPRADDLQVALQRGTGGPVLPHPGEPGRPDASEEGSGNHRPHTLRYAGPHPRLCEHPDHGRPPDGRGLRRERQPILGQHHRLLRIRPRERRLPDPHLRTPTGQQVSSRNRAFGPLRRSGRRGHHI